LNEIINEDIGQNNDLITNIPKDASIDLMDEAALKNQYMIALAQVNSEDCGLPMSIFDNVLLNNFNFCNGHNVIKMI